MQDQTEQNSSVVRSLTNTALIRGLKPGGIYVFQVRARTVAGFGRYSGKMYFQTMTEGKWFVHKSKILTDDSISIDLAYVHVFGLGYILG